MTAAGQGPQRRCLVCRKDLDRDDSVRFVLDPDGVAAIDWRRKLPGRGASVCWSKEGLRAAGQPGFLSRAFKQQVRLPPEQGWPLEAARAYVRERQRELVGLAATAGQLKSGAGVCERALQRGWPDAIGLAADVGQAVDDRWSRRAKGFELELFRSVCTSEELGLALGRAGPRSVFVLGPGPTATALRRELLRGAALL